MIRPYTLGGDDFEKILRGGVMGGSFVSNMHPSPDIWVVTLLDSPDITGFQMLTPRAKKWALGYREVDDPSEVDSMLWVRGDAAGEILADLANETTLHVLMDDGEGGNA